MKKTIIITVLVILIFCISCAGFRLATVAKHCTGDKCDSVSLKIDCNTTLQQ